MWFATRFPPLDIYRRRPIRLVEGAGRREDGRSGRDEIRAGPVTLNRPRSEDFTEWAALREASRAHLTRWEPDWTDEDVSATRFRSMMRAYDRERHTGRAAPFFIRVDQTGALAGGLTFSNIRRGAARSATLGYWIGAPYLRRGYARAAVEAAIAHALGELGLNRVEAACQPGNTASRDLLRKVGMTEEGLARDYLHINGAWRDHCIFAITARDFEASRRSRPSDASEGS